jgi:tripartite-type tricarboxylate transporter receptor subunit TctC
MIPYKGGVEGVTGVMGGEIDAYFATVSLAATLKNNPRARLLALTTGRGQSRFLPGVKTFPELGMPDVVYRSLYGVAIRSGTPQPIRSRLEQALLQVAQSPDMKAARRRSRSRITGNGGRVRQEVQANIRVHQAAKNSRAAHASSRGVTFQSLNRSAGPDGPR